MLRPRLPRRGLLRPPSQASLPTAHATRSMRRPSNPRHPCSTPCTCAPQVALDPVPYGASTGAFTLNLWFRPGNMSGACGAAGAAAGLGAGGEGAGVQGLKCRGWNAGAASRAGGWAAGRAAGRSGCRQAWMGQGTARLLARTPAGSLRTSLPRPLPLAPSPAHPARAAPGLSYLLSHRGKANGLDAQGSDLAGWGPNQIQVKPRRQAQP